MNNLLKYIVFGISLLILASCSSRKSEIYISGPHGPIKGTYVEGKNHEFNATTIIIPGGGPIDRNGNGRKLVRSNNYQMLAHELSYRGIASLRYDKRGMFSSKKAVTNPYNARLNDLTSDVNLWVKRTKSNYKCVWLIAHSEGGLIAMYAAQKYPNICGLILIATPGKSIADVLKDHGRAAFTFNVTQDRIDHVVKSWQHGRIVPPEMLTPLARAYLKPSVQAYLIDFIKIDPFQLMQGVNVPVLIVQGDNDLRVKPENADVLQSANPNARQVRFPKMTHMLKNAPYGNRVGIRQTYYQQTIPLTLGLVDAIADFILANS